VAWHEPAVEKHTKSDWDDWIWPVASVAAMPRMSAKMNFQILPNAMQV